MGWRYQIPMLREMGLRVIAPDCLGYGKTVGPQSGEKEEKAIAIATNWLKRMPPKIRRNTPTSTAPTISKSSPTMWEPRRSSSVDMTGIATPPHQIHCMDTNSQKQGRSPSLPRGPLASRTCHARLHRVCALCRSNKTLPSARRLRGDHRAALRLPTAIPERRAGECDLLRRRYQEIPVCAIWGQDGR